MTNEFKQVCVVGLGYIGLPTAAVIAQQGVSVVGVDLNAATVDAVSRGEVPFAEPDLGTTVAGAVSTGNLRASRVPEPADAYIVAVPTPVTESHDADLRHIDAAAASIAPHLSGGELIVLESTSPPGTTARLAERVLAERPDLSLEGAPESSVVYFAHCPERVLPGRIMIEIVTNDRIVGGLNDGATERASDLYGLFTKGELLRTDAVTAEMSKLVENSFRDVNIAFANELSIISDKLNIDVGELIRLANHHPRVNILNPGPGVGGHCIAVDPWFIVSKAPEESRMIRMAREVNDAKPQFVVNKIVEAARKFDKPTIAVLGLAFKANVDDLRGSPAVEITRLLAEILPDAKVLAVEPHVDELPDALVSFENVELVEAGEALADANILVKLTGHAAFDDVMSEIPINTVTISAAAA
nr:UDP-N-acetyl-D-mannosamine dehydrogenase [Spelaeicoccus albus]